MVVRIVAACLQITVNNAPAVTVAECIKYLRYACAETQQTNTNIDTDCSRPHDEQFRYQGSRC